MKKNVMAMMTTMMMRMMMMMMMTNNVGQAERHQPGDDDND